MRSTTDAEAFVPYEQMPGEDGRTWHNFMAYRDLGPQRSLQKAAKIVGKSAGYLTEQSRQGDWVARCRAWDAECDRVRREATLEAQRKMVIEHARCAAVLRQRAMEQIDPEKLAERMVLDPDQAAKWLALAIKIEQTSIGLPTERTAVSVDADKSADAVYFDSLPRHKFLELAQQAMDTLKKDSQK